MKCTDKKCQNRSSSCSCKKTLDHLSRIEGQLRTLRKYIEQGKRCEDVAMLSTSIAKSFDTLRARTLKNFFKNEVFVTSKIPKKTEEAIDTILKLYKK